MTGDLFSIANQHVLVSGGSRGICRAIAKGFAERGATVIITGPEEQTLKEAAAEIRHAASGRFRAYLRVQRGRLEIDSGLCKRASRPREICSTRSRTWTV